VSDGRGIFIVLEGGEGSGKSTQAALLAGRLRADGRDVVETFEPGGTARGALLRSVLLEDETPLEPRAELLLMAADRAQHVAELIEPSLARGAVVVCDRFSPSTLVYQGCARGLPIDVVADICRIAEGDIRPDLVIVLDVSEDVAAERAPRHPDRLEREGREFHATVRAAYRKLAPEHGWLVVDGNGGIDRVGARVWAAVEPTLVE